MQTNQDQSQNILNDKLTALQAPKQQVFTPFSDS